jgi:hypothetical protein
MTLTKFALSILIFLFILCLNKAYGQDEEFKMFPDSEIMNLVLDFSGHGFAIRILNLPKEVMGCALRVQNLNDTFSGNIKIEGRQLFLEMKGNYSRADTFVVYLTSDAWRLQYPAEVFTLHGSNQVKLGANCYNLNCVPENDPWMPTGYNPFLFPKNGFYINPKNGKIKKGLRLINSGNYSICELENWKYISPYGIYFDKNENKFRGSDLIKRGKIVLANWNLEVFHLHWFP